MIGRARGSLIVVLAIQKLPHESTEPALNVREIKDLHDNRGTKELVYAAIREMARVSGTIWISTRLGLSNRISYLHKGETGQCQSVSFSPMPLISHPPLDITREIVSNIERPADFYVTFRRTRSIRRLE